MPASELKKKETVSERFWNKVAVGQPNECFLWTGSIDIYGFGRICIDYKKTQAHRLSWELANGKSSEGLDILRTCQHKHCVNPAHLYAVNALTQTNEEKFLRFNSKTGPIPAHCPELGPCWKWTGQVQNKGYGYINAWPGRKHISAHRFAYEYYIGPIGGQNVLHKCDNRKCVNPAHLFLGSLLDNVQDMIRKGRQCFRKKKITSPS